MQTFRYLALNAEQQPVRGELQAESVATAVSLLEAQGLVVQSIGLASAGSPFGPASGESSSADRTAAENLEQAVLAAHLETILPRAREIAPALHAYAEELPPRRRKQLESVLRVLERAEPANAAATFSSLPEYWIPLLSAASTTRDPGRILAEFLHQSERAAELRRQWWLTLAYPLLVAFIAAVVLTALSVLIIPTFREMFRDFALRLPWLTVLVINLGAWITSGRILVAAGLAALGVLVLVLLVRTLPRAWREWFGDRWGTPLGRTNAMARFAQYTANLLEAGVSIPDALRISGFTTRSPRLQRAAFRFARQLDAARGGAGPRQFTKTFAYAVTSDLPLPSRIRLLREISVCHSERSAALLSWTHGIIEPLAVCVVGGLVAVVVLSLFLPLFSLLRGLSGA